MCVFGVAPWVFPFHFPQDIPQTPLGSLGAEQIGLFALYEEARYTCSPVLYTGEQDSEK